MENCVICTKNFSSTYYRSCLRCHTIICSSCQPKHTTAYKDHVFRIPEIRSACTYCKKHNKDFSLYCTTCSKPICIKCSQDNHEHHNIVDVRYLKKQFAFDDSKIKETLGAIHDDIKTRVNEIGEFDVTLRKINNRINSIRPKEFMQLEKQLKELKASKYFYEEIQRYQRVVLYSTTDNDFLEKYAKFQELKLHFIVNPPACEEIPKLPLIHNVPTDEEIFSFLYTEELSKTSLDVQKPSDFKSHIKEELETKIQEIRIWKDALYCILNDIELVGAAWRLNPNEPKTVQFKAPQALRVNKETEEVLRKYEKCIADVIGMMNKKSNKVIEKQNEVDRKTMMERTEFSEKEQMRLEHIKKETDELKIRKEGFEKEQLDMQTRLEHLNKENEDMARRLETLSDQLRMIKGENEDLKTRLSQVAGAKLTAGNSNIADLGDKNRPTRIAEMYSELYDTEWTDTFDKLAKQNRNWTEEYILRHLFIVLQGCFRTCKEIANEQMTNMCIHMFPNLPPSEVKKYMDTHTTEIKQIRDARKGTAVNVGKFLSKSVYGYGSFNDDCVRYQGIDRSLIQRITKSEFGEKCAVICWLMVVQDPEMNIDRDIQKGENFNKDLYKEYTKSGTRVAYSVWPALYLHEGGPLLTKGVVQCYN